MKTNAGALRPLPLGQHDGLVAVLEKTLDKGQQNAGLVTWWQLSGITSWEHLRDGWLQAGLPEEQLPPTVGMVTGLRRALRQFEGARTLIRPIDRSGYSVVDETSDAAAKALDYSTRFSAWIEDDVLCTRGLDSTERMHLLGRVMAELQVLDPSDVSSWLVGLVRGAQAVRLRDSGGVYFVPEHSAALWSQIGDVLRLVSGHRVHELPTLRTGKAVEAILDALTVEAEQASRELAEELDTGDLKARALRTRANRCDEMAAKLRSYESLLGVQLDAMRAKVDELNGRVAAAILTAESE